MKNLLSLTLLCAALQGFSQQNADLLQASGYFKEAELAAKNKWLWPAKVYGPTLFVDPVSRLTYANQPDSAGLLKLAAGIYHGVLPKQVLIANTAVDWGGKRWSVVQWPLPKDKEDRVSLILHESFHRIQRGLGFADKSPTADHLSTLDGRIYFLLELQALKRALAKPLRQRAKDLESALAFRYKRRELFPTTFAAENELEMNEGLAEFTGMVLGRQPENLLVFLAKRADSAGNRKSLIRSAPYLTGALYGYLLYQKDKKWTKLIDTASGFSGAVEQVYHLSRAGALNDRELASLAEIYDDKGIIQSERQKESERLRLRAEYADLFTQKPVLRVRLVKAGINFDPNTVFNLGTLGNVYPTGEIRDEWGSVKVDSGGMLLKDWQMVWFPMEGFTQVGNLLHGKGWTLRLNEGWQLHKVDERQFQLTKLK